MSRVVPLSILDGHRRAAPTEIAHQRLNGGHLYLLAEVSAPTATWDTACRQVISRAVSAFGGQERATEAAALQVAADSVNELLLAKNQTLPSDDHIWASLNAAFVRDDHLYLAQAGPALTYIARGGQLTRFPKQVSASQGDPLGQQPTVRCRMAHFQVQAGDIVALVSSQLPTLADEATLTKLLNKGDAQEIATALYPLRERDDFSALFVQIEASDLPVTAAPVPSEEEVPPPSPRRLPRPSIPSFRRQAAPSEPPPPPEERPATPAARPEPVPKPRASKSGIPAASAAAAASLRARLVPNENGAVVAQPVGPAASASPLPKKSAPPVPPVVVERPRRAAAPTAPLATTHYTDAPDDSEAGHSLWHRLMVLWLGLLVRLIDGAERFIAWTGERVGPRLSASSPLLDRIGEAFWRVMNAIGRGLRRVLRQLLPGSHEEASAANPAAPRPEQSSAMGKALLLLLPLLLVALIAGAALRLRGEDVTGGTSPSNPNAPAQSSNAEALALLRDARELLSQAGTVDQATAQRLATEATGLVDQAIGMDQGLAASADVSDLRAQAQAILATTGTVAYPPLVTLASVPANSQPTEVVFGGGTPFALERAAGAAYRVLVGQPQPVTLEPLATQPLLAAQQNLGNGVIVGTPTHLVWVPKGNTRPYDALMVMTAENQLFEFDPQSGLLKNLAFVAITGDSDVRAAEGYDGNLYLLDGVAHQIWKYTPDATGQYSQAPTPWLTANGQTQVNNPVDFAIDGFIYILDAGGAVGRFQKGEPHAFTLASLPSAISRAAAISKVPPEATDFFVADGTRVLRFAQDGAFVKEYRAPAGRDWGMIQDLVFDGNTEALYLLTDSGLYSLDLRGQR